MMDCLKCDICTLRFQNQEWLTEHLNDTHLCPYCPGFALPKRSALLQHIRGLHKNVCPCCKEKFTCPTKLLAHLNKVHNYDASALRRELSLKMKQLNIHQPSISMLTINPPAHVVVPQIRKVNRNGRTQPPVIEIPMRKTPQYYHDICFRIAATDLPQRVTSQVPHVLLPTDVPNGALASIGNAVIEKCSTIVPSTVQMQNLHRDIGRIYTFINAHRGTTEESAMVVPYGLICNGLADSSTLVQLSVIMNTTTMNATMTHLDVKTLLHEWKALLDHALILTHSAIVDDKRDTLKLLSLNPQANFSIELSVTSWCSVTLTNLFGQYVRQHPMHIQLLYRYIMHWAFSDPSMAGVGVTPRTLLIMTIYYLQRYDIIKHVPMDLFLKQYHFDRPAGVNYVPHVDDELCLTSGNRNNLLSLPNRRMLNGDETLGLLVLGWFRFYERFKCLTEVVQIRVTGVVQRVGMHVWGNQLHVENPIETHINEASELDWVRAQSSISAQYKRLRHATHDLYSLLEGEPCQTSSEHLRQLSKGKLNFTKPLLNLHPHQTQEGVLSELDGPDVCKDLISSVINFLNLSEQ